MSHVRHKRARVGAVHQTAAMARPETDDAAFPGWVRQSLGPNDFDDADPDDVRMLAPFAVPEEIPAKTVLFREREPPRALYIIERGKVELFVERRGERRIVQTCGPGATVGDLPVMLGLAAYAYSAATRPASRLLRFSMETIRALVEANPEICFRFLRLVSWRLERAERRLLELSGRSALEQIVQLLIREADEQHSNAVRITQSDLAAALGLSRQTVSRVLGELERLGLLKRGRRQLEILDHHRLIAISDPRAIH